MTRALVILTCFLSVYTSSVVAEDVEVLRLAAEREIVDGKLWLQLGEALLQSDLSAAEKAMKKAIGADRSAGAYAGLGRVYMATPGRLDESVRYLRKA